MERASSDGSRALGGEADSPKLHTIAAQEGLRVFIPSRSGSPHAPRAARSIWGLKWKRRRVVARQKSLELQRVGR